MAKSKSSTKKMRGKSVVAEQTPPTYRPSIYFDNGNLPASLKDVKPGAQVSLTITGRVVRRTENAKGVSDLQFEIGKVAGGGGKKAKD
jgi:hypothetical protein